MVAATAVATCTSTAEASDRSTAVVELFTSQGCTACVEANQILDGLADHKGVIALTFPVDYLDYIGWKDTLAQPQFTDRQRAYTDRFKVREIYAPEVVVDGRREMLGLDKSRIEALMKREAGVLRDGPAIQVNAKKTRAEVGAGRAPSGHGEVWLVRYDPRTQQVRVKAGDNKGKTLVVRNVVRDLVRLGAWSGDRRSYRLPKADDDSLKSVILVQGADGGHILAATKL